jgi:NHS family xanthosine MFS transporter
MPLSCLPIIKWPCFLSFLCFWVALCNLTNAYGDVFLDEFKLFPVYAESFVIKYSTIIMSISQVSETLFILAIPFFLNEIWNKKGNGYCHVGLGFPIWSYLHMGILSDNLWMIVLLLYCLRNGI